MRRLLSINLLSTDRARALVLCAALLLPAAAWSASDVQAIKQGDSLTLSNDSISATWTTQGGALRLQSVTNEFTGTTLASQGDTFEFVPKEGPVLHSSDLKIVNGARDRRDPNRGCFIESCRSLAGQADSHRTRGQIRQSARHLEGDASRRRELRSPGGDDSCLAAGPSCPDRSHRFVGAGRDGCGPGEGLADLCRTPGFWASNIPCRSAAFAQIARRAGFRASYPLQANQSVTYSSVFGAAHPAQLRRDFLKYVELERAHPYRTFLHYNTWYDLGYFDRYNEQGAVEAVNGFGEQLTKQRGVKLDSFLLDDGWDDPTTLWKFNPGFPDGLTNVAQAAAKYNAAPGIWLSPWGGYDKPKQQRLASARAQGFETNEGGFALSGPKYYRYFRDACFAMIDKYGVNQFKFDGTGNANEVIKGSEFDSDFDAAIHLIGELRGKKPDIYINLTTGTYPSPFWLLYADSIWRGGDDHSFAGVGTNRQRWITYRDSQTYRWVVEDGPLFPINSLMLHGTIYARDAERLSSDPGHDFADEVHSYFGTGTQLQEMYITPSLLAAPDWDVLAETAKWSRANAQVLKDSHWIGGDPAKLEVYGWAAWSPERAIVTLRNPSDRAQDFTASLAWMLELPAGSASEFVGHSPWKNDGSMTPVTIGAQDQHAFHLQPFQVLTLELIPRK